MEYSRVVPTKGYIPANFGCLEIRCSRCNCVVREMTLKEMKFIEKHGETPDPIDQNQVIENELAPITTALEGD